MIKYIDTIEGITPQQLEGFFVGWLEPLKQEKHFELFEKSDYFWLAIDEDNNKVVGFITAISDKVLSAYIPLLEVVPSQQGKGIGRKLVELMLDTLKSYYMIDLVCDEDKTPFYKKYGMCKATAMMFRNYDKQGGK
ncbi:GNAT family N-acetyltransferase [Alkaliphilus hydrothermalis]|uniref:Ribosomal protein S18 acetylase RimI-like enzyme n=1 Tax=Alkaliphilus hydrothermalis TaxID=1482730 RepID=A0ABS2NLH2_9FIRM|nr:GNAT family N-acetyltransferase [Alkaliphilus hydrothermalis]MBM7613793.1 ribosomal protein S18 acetylase RimI-like enzyme [Alkaliphilus hydrothermalis]